MQYRNLGKAKVKVSVLCLGTWEFAQTKAWGPGQLEEYRKIVDCALDAGINFIDTAEGYGKSEAILGELLKGRRDEVVLATKMSRIRRGFSYHNMRRGIEGSLDLLNTDFVDLYQIHWPKIKGHWSGGESDMESKDYEDIYTSMERLIDEGLIGAAGVSNFRLHHLGKFRDEAFETIVTDQVPFNLLWRGYDEPDIVDFCRRKGLRYLTYSSLAQGLLTGKIGKEATLAEIQRANVLFNEPIYGRAMQVVQTVGEVAKEVDATPAQVALRWVIERELTVSALVGIRNVKELEENIEAVNLNLTGEQMDRLDSASLEFWKPMPPKLELWLHDNTRANVQRLGIETDKGY
jgi:aryl-alcohol dehydrogenase-like predicted oxidoreductase